VTFDIQSSTGMYYDLDPNFPNDVPFYKNQIPSPDSSVLELGCGTGRVLLPLSESCGYIHGIDVSETMLAVCSKKLKTADISSNQAHVEAGNITSFDLGRTFDLIIAPDRVFQILETDVEVDGLLKCVRQHLAPSGTCIFNVFKPLGDPNALRREWCTDKERLAWEIMVEDERITCHSRRHRVDVSKHIAYWELVYRRYAGEELKDETVLKNSVRCYYPEPFEQIIVNHGFRIINRWGGYAGEIYGEGPEFVLQFTNTDG
jgi:SAM-dependent methyltransferase